MERSIVYMDARLEKADDVRLGATNTRSRYTMQDMACVRTSQPSSEETNANKSKAEGADGVLKSDLSSYD